jgi:hypothetical protein
MHLKSIQKPISFPPFHSLLERDTFQTRRFFDSGSVGTFHSGLLVRIQSPILLYQHLSNGYGCSLQYLMLEQLHDALKESSVLRTSAASDITID